MFSRERGGEGFKKRLHVIKMVLADLSSDLETDRH